MTIGKKISLRPAGLRRPKRRGLRPRRRTIFGAVVGSLVNSALLNGLVLANVSSYIQQIVIGVIIVLAVAFDTFAKSRRRRI